MLRSSAGVIVVLVCVFGARAESDLSIGRYTDHVRTRVEAALLRELSNLAADKVLSGTVTHVGSNVFFLQSGNEAIKVLLSAASRPSRGDVVAVAGAPTLEGARVVFAAKTCRKIGVASLPSPQIADAGKLTYAALNAAERQTDIDAHRVVLEGRAVGLTESGFAIDVDALPVTVVAESWPDYISTCGATRPVVRVTGVVEKVLDQAALLGQTPYVMGVKLHLATPSDVELRPDLVYLSNLGDRRVKFVVVAAFVCLAVLSLLLIVIIVRQSRRRLRIHTLMTERKRMADDLHDTVEQHLVGASMLLQMNQVKETLDILSRAKREMRDIVWGLKNDDMMRLTPTEMIQEYARSETRKGICRVEARLAGLPAQLDASKMRDLSLILREAVGNAVKHGGAKKIAISSDPKPNGGWMIRVGNDGVPFNPATAPGIAEGHFGIEGMKARARRLQATISFVAKGERIVLVLETNV